MGPKCRRGRDAGRVLGEKDVNSSHSPHLARPPSRAGPCLIRPASNDTFAARQNAGGALFEWVPLTPSHPHPDLLQTDTCSACFKTPTRTSPRAVLPAVRRGALGGRGGKRGPGLIQGLGIRSRETGSKGLSQAGSGRTRCDFITLRPLMRARCHLG